MTRFTAIDLSALTPPDIIETIDYEAIVKDMRDDLVARFPAIVGVIDLESEPARKLIEAFAYRELLLRARINDSARAVLLLPLIHIPEPTRRPPISYAAFCLKKKKKTHPQGYRLMLEKKNPRC